MEKAPLTLPSGGDVEDLHAAVDVREIDALSIRREHEAGEADLAFLVRLQDVWRGNLRLRFAGLLVRAAQPLSDLAGGGINDDQLAGLAGGDEQPAVGTERDRLGPQAGQFDLESIRSDDLVDRRDDAIRVMAADEPCIRGAFLRDETGRDTANRQ